MGSSLNPTEIDRIYYNPSLFFHFINKPRAQKFTRDAIQMQMSIFEKPIVHSRCVFHFLSYFYSVSMYVCRTRAE